jgi:translation initiation factor 2B subunit (eIF-2B alpha/beta/delta family)
MLVTDAETGHYLQSCDIALVGADTILPDGSIINKMGTYLLATAARAVNVPFYVTARTQKIRHNDQVLLEEMDPQEIHPPIQNVEIRNTYFDITPATYITSIISDKGILTPDEIQQYAVDRARAEELLKS